jgi:hypothetical protein
MAQVVDQLSRYVIDHAPFALHVAQYGSEVSLFNLPHFITHPPISWIFPLTVSASVGPIVPIPTCPSLVIVIRSL